MEGPVEGPIIWRPRDAAGDSLFEVDVFCTLVIFVVLDKECDSGAFDDQPTPCKIRILSRSSLSVWFYDRSIRRAVSP